ncbi:MAG TPA: hypothetical protein VFR90_03230 [Methylibium sp.]|uniref:hypothetical protein n=1 Tax=Methylibium sp. TaxID=2067992 RepID=UPI002DBC8E1F|nr:hypothetical protein [Methylibium sp.]HEU4458113.1 hypothetical protein [Methylibium sp.]
MTSETLLGSIADAPQQQVALLANQRQELTARMKGEVARSNSIDAPTRELHAPSIYCRETFIKAGVGLVFEPAKQAHLGWVLGDLTIIRPDGEQRLTGYESTTIPAGERWAAFAHADTWWTTVHANPTNEQDSLKLRDLLLTPEAVEALQ